ncbi:MAG: hypothetical protein HY692_06145 [Cyanobacteria bacterium NC_groundwater_1444_Ag_S-0.65um_54_12]|nr:hypothetical protein [Cyanobacteria bacterium NC_groundwater_1444_Ag_S-0.65um_54_12]
MFMCFFHPKQESSELCKLCGLPICEACCQERYCPACYKLVKQLRKGQSDTKKPSLKREEATAGVSLTRQLMVSRLSAQVFPEDSSKSVFPARRIKVAASRGRNIRNQQCHEKALANHGKEKSFNYGMLWGALLVLLVTVIASQLGSRLIARTADFPLLTRESIRRSPASNTEATPALSAGSWSSNSAIASPNIPGQLTGTAPLLSALAPDTSADYPEQKKQDPHHARSAGGEGARPIELCYKPPTALISWPTAGNTIRLVTYFKIHLTHPEKFAVLQLAIDGKSGNTLPTSGERIEWPLDTSRLTDGEHTFQVLGMTDSGELISSEPIAIWTSNEPS